MEQPSNGNRQEVLLLIAGTFGRYYQGSRALHGENKGVLCLVMMTEDMLIGMRDRRVSDPFALENKTVIYSCIGKLCP